MHITKELLEEMGLEAGLKEESKSACIAAGKGNIHGAGHRPPKKQPLVELCDSQPSLLPSTEAP